MELGKGDAPSASASAKDIQREKAIDAQLKDRLKLPVYLQEHERRTTRVDVDVRGVNILSYRCLTYTRGSTLTPRSTPHYTHFTSSKTILNSVMISISVMESRTG